MSILDKQPNEGSNIHSTLQRNQPRIGASTDKFSELMYSYRSKANFGFVLNDCDFFLQNYSTNTLAIIEVKTKQASLSKSQAINFPLIDKTFEAGAPFTGVNYLGYYVLTFENLCFDDGRATMEYLRTGYKAEIDQTRFFNFLSKHF